MTAYSIQKEIEQNTVETPVAKESRSAEEIEKEQKEKEQKEKEQKQKEQKEKEQDEKSREIVAQLRAQGGARNWSEMMTEIRQTRGEIPDKREPVNEPSEKAVLDFDRVKIHQAIRLVQRVEEREDCSDNEKLQYLNAVTTRRTNLKEMCRSSERGIRAPANEASETNRLLKVVQLKKTPPSRGRARPQTPRIATPGRVAAICGAFDGAPNGQKSWVGDGGKKGGI